MQLLKKTSLQAETVTFSSALACHSNTNVSNSPAGSKLSQVMSLEHHPDKGTGSFHHHCWEPSRTAPVPLHPYNRARKQGTGQTSLFYIFSQTAMKGQKGRKKTSKHQKAQNHFCAFHRTESGLCSMLLIYLHKGLPKVTGLLIPEIQMLPDSSL